MLLCTLAGGGLASCALIEFEQGPNAVRGLDVVYSEQEDMTFLTWRLRDDVQIEDVHFEIYLGDEYRRLDLLAAPYAAKPYACNRSYLCFQHQIAGDYTYPQDVHPVRSVHRVHGMFQGSAPRVHRSSRTFDISPIGVEKNARIDPRRLDWFADNKVPLRRAYQWQLVTYGDEGCQAPSAGAWASLGERLSLPASWVGGAHCLAARPVRADGGGVVVTVPFKPSAEVVWELQDYVPDEVRHPTVYGFLADLQIGNASRCEQAVNMIVRTIEGAMRERPGESVSVGVYTPISHETGEPQTGCSQRAQQDYPITQMLNDIKSAASVFPGERVRVVWIYLNNVELPPSERLRDQLESFGASLYLEPELAPFPWIIGSNTMLMMLPQATFTGWRPISDENFVADLKAAVTYNVPFRTMNHDLGTSVPLEKPAHSTRPLAFKVCDATPPLTLIMADRPYPGTTSSSIPWPQDSAPSYHLYLEPQDLVPFAEYRRNRVAVVLEVCERFCDHPFRSRSGRDFVNWESTEVCQWTL